jgi:hypothetical protein
MRSVIEDKRLILLFSVLALGALMILAVGLGEVSFREARSFGWNPARGVRSLALGFITTFAEIPLPMHLGLWVLLFLLVFLIAALISPASRWRLIKNIIRMAVIYWGFYILFTRLRERLAQIALDLNAMGSNPFSSAGGEPPPEFAPPSNSSSLAYLASFIIALLLVLIGWRLFVFWRKKRQDGGLQPLEKIAKIAHTSLKDLSSGRDATDVIMKCYYRMNEVVADKRKLERGAAMTPAEFAVQLERAGLPGDAVRRLTRLFEDVRYGAHRTGAGDVNEAVACLNVILHHCGEPL